MAGILLALFLGWAGGYRFYKGQWKLGLLYLLTGGIAGMGWLFDIGAAVLSYMPKTFRCEIKGGFAESKKNPQIKRREILADVPVGSKLIIETDIYNGSPYYLVCGPDGRDLGAVPSEINAKIRNDYKNPKITAELTDKSDPEHARMKLTVSH